MQDLRGKKLVLLGFTLFSMFFGAGNLIFPPHLGAQAGANLWPAFAGFAVSAIGLPIMGVAAVANADGLDRLASRSNPSALATAATPMMGRPMALTANPAKAGQRFAPACAPRWGGKIRFPAPKNMEKSVKPRSTSFLPRRSCIKMPPFRK